MKSDLLATSPLLGLALIALFLFLTVFALAVAITLGRKRGAFDGIANLPLEDGTPPQNWRSVMSDEERVIHEVDGIQEYDNQLPNWWLGTLFGTIVFAGIYWYVYQTGAFLDSPFSAYVAEKDRIAAAEASQMKVGEATPEALMAMSRDPKVLALGKSVFTSTCAACHRADGGGIVGPNLTDQFWLHGAAPDKVYKTVSVGVADKGMPAWLPQLGALKTQAVVAYVLTLRETNAPGGKAPQGDRETLTQR